MRCAVEIETWREEREHSSNSSTRSEEKVEEEKRGGGKEKLQTGSGGVLRPTKAGATGSNDQGLGGGSPAEQQPFR
ncbi:unnamed protein product [Spirodela intermedia]|uniref:Uncharacterized protein n=1 Tax=Spirodela intermedia TaxID=51605 RepID=A0ABN7EAF2_SPIIN|nr:unnamed protein product [Spirodela intermedia]